MCCSASSEGSFPAVKRHLRCCGTWAASETRVLPQILEHNLKSIVLTKDQGRANKDSDFVSWLLLDSCSRPAPLVAMPAPTIQANDPATVEFLKAWAFRTTLDLWSLLSRLLCLMILPSLLVQGVFCFPIPGLLGALGVELMVFPI